MCVGSQPRPEPPDLISFPFLFQEPVKMRYLGVDGEECPAENDKVGKLANTEPAYEPVGLAMPLGWRRAAKFWPCRPSTSTRTSQEV